MEVDARLVRAGVFALAALVAFGYGLTMDDVVSRVAVLAGAALMLGGAVKVGLDVLADRRDRH